MRRSGSRTRPHRQVLPGRLDAPLGQEQLRAEADAGDEVPHRLAALQAVPALVGRAGAVLGEGLRGPLGRRAVPHRVADLLQPVVDHLGPSDPGQQRAPRSGGPGPTARRRPRRSARPPGVRPSGAAWSWPRGVSGGSSTLKPSRTHSGSPWRTRTSSIAGDCRVGRGGAPVDSAGGDPSARRWATKAHVMGARKRAIARGGDGEDRLDDAAFLAAVAGGRSRAATWATCAWPGCWCGGTPRRPSASWHGRSAGGRRARADPSTRPAPPVGWPWCASRPGPHPTRSRSTTSWRAARAAGSPAAGTALQPGAAGRAARRRGGRAGRPRAAAVTAAATFAVARRLSAALSRVRVGPPPPGCPDAAARLWWPRSSSGCAGQPPRSSTSTGTSGASRVQGRTGGSRWPSGQWST